MKKPETQSSQHNTEGEKQAEERMLPNFQTYSETRITKAVQCGEKNQHGTEQRPQKQTHVNSGEGGMGVTANGYGTSSGDNENVLKLDSGDGYTTL